MTSPKFMRTLIEWDDKHSNRLHALETAQVLSLRRTLIVFAFRVGAVDGVLCSDTEASSGEEMSLLLL